MHDCASLPDRSSRDHVLLVDASAWMAAQTPARRTLLDEARTTAIRYIRALPSSDRVMLVRADALATPLTGFENQSRARTRRPPSVEFSPVRAAQPGPKHYEFAAQALRLEGKRAGEIVSGSART